MRVRFLWRIYPFVLFELVTVCIRCMHKGEEGEWRGGVGGLEKRGGGRGEEKGLEEGGSFSHVRFWVLTLVQATFWLWHDILTFYLWWGEVLVRSLCSSYLSNNVGSHHPFPYASASGALSTEVHPEALICMSSMWRQNQDSAKNPGREIALDSGSETSVPQWRWVGGEWS